MDATAESAVFRCPVCGEGLVPGDGEWTCAQRHSFNVSREGYVNLVQSHRFNRKRSGDDAQMLRARRRILTGGLYDPLLAAICEMLGSRVAASSGGIRYLDVGCGEGYFTSNVTDYLRRGHQAIPVHGIGVDASREGVRAAARQFRHLTWIVANAFSLPLLSGVVSVASVLMAPVSVSEIRRVLHPGGVFLVASAGRSHLQEIRELVYREPVATPQRRNAIADVLTLEEQRAVHFGFTAPDAATAADLVTMTPYYWTLGGVLPPSIETLAGREISADFVLSRYVMR